MKELLARPVSIKLKYAKLSPVSAIATILTPSTTLSWVPTPMSPGILSPTAFPDSKILLIISRSLMMSGLKKEITRVYVNRP